MGVLGFVFAATFLYLPLIIIEIVLRITITPGLFLAFFIGNILFWILILILNRRIAFKRRCPHCREKFAVPKESRQGHYRRNLLHPVYELLLNAFPTLGQSSPETARQSIALMWLCIGTIFLAAAVYFPLRLCNRVIGINWLEQWDVVGSLWFDATVALFLVGIVFALGYGLRRFAVTPFIMLMLLILIFCGSCFALLIPAREHDMFWNGCSDLSIEDCRKTGMKRRPEWYIPIWLQNSSYKKEHRKEIIDYLEENLKPWMAPDIKQLIRDEPDWEIKEKLKETLKKVEQLNERPDG
ncbi:MAG: hypothetical protein E3J72_18040 [Planctomycetota bacterium]|nr:MAG: hypothetical protein E3J72_18040 [Planctomycetota bacterium]